MAETVGESTRASSSTANGRPPGWPPCGVEVSITSLPCTLRCLSARLGDVSHAYHRHRVQELGSEASWHLFFTRRASTPWSSFGRRGWPMSAIRARGELRMSGMGAGELCEGPCSFVCACRVRPCERSLSHMSLWVFVAFVSICDICHFRRAGMSYIESMPIA